MIKLLLLFLFSSVSLFSYVNAQTNYCRLSCDGQRHTVCRRRDVNCGIDVNNCGSPYEAIDLDEEDMQLILDVHNELRNKVATGQERIGRQPPAANMKALSYNRELGSIAQCLTNSCEFNHDECRRTRNYEYVGQNIGSKMFSNENRDYRSVINSTIREWYNEVKDFRAIWVDSFPQVGVVIGHYTQVVWAETIEVGCGLTSYFSMGWYTYFLACNYGPGGNYLGEPVYESGRTASDCSGLPKNSKYRGLCGEARIN